MDTNVNWHIIDHYLCLEPEFGEELLPLYPEFLGAEEKAQFELHVEACEYCQECWKLWQAKGLALRIEALLKRAQALLAEGHYDRALERYNKAVDIEPRVLETPEGQEFFRAEVWLPLTTARSKEVDILPYLTPSYAPETYEIAAAKSLSPFPLTVEYADGKIKGEITAAGRVVFFELMEASEEFEAGVMLVGKILQPMVMLKAWEIVRGKKQRLGTIADLFGSSEFPDVINTLRTFKVFPG